MSGICLGLVPPEWPWVVVAFFFLTSLLYELSLGFYNAFIPEIADDHSINRVSAWGFALGYVGGALPLILAILLLQFGDRIGIHGTPNHLRLSLVIMGLWWGGFTLPVIWVLRDRRPPPAHKTSPVTAGRQALGEVIRTIRNVRHFKVLALFLLAFFFYNDGVQTVISQASTFAMQELKFATSDLILLILMIQFLAVPGALVVGWLSDRIGQRITLTLCLAVWVGLIVSAFFIYTKPPFWILGAVLAMVMGGVQSVSRAIMGVMTPERHSAEFFGFFNLSGKATGILGSFLFGLTIYLTGSSRYAIVSLLVLFLLGWALITRVDIAQGRRQALQANSTSS
jgi:UMF1 family MFS transporter